jgi:F-type H+-transporting ATPase subunit delta
MAEVHDNESRAGEEGSSERRVARVYAEALLDVATEKNLADEIGAELQEIVKEVYGKSPEVETALSSPVIKRTVKAPVIEHAFKGQVSDLVLNFLNVLNNKDRLILLRHATAAYRDLLDEREKRVRVTVRSAVPLSDEQSEHISKAIADATGLYPVIASRIEPELLGGMIVQVGDQVFDSSVRNRIENIRTQLLGRSNYEIQTGRDRFSHPG